MNTAAKSVRTITRLAFVAVVYGLTILMGGCAGTGIVTSPPAKMKMTTEIPESIMIPDKVETRLGTLDFFDGFPADKTVRKMHDYLYFHRAVDVFLDEMSAASIFAIREGFRSMGVRECHQIAVFESLMDSKALWLTANTETVYASNFLDLKKDGPIVIESPPNVLGILDDMWMRYVGDIGNAGPDKGQGGKFLILPPGYDSNVPDGYHVFRSRTYSVWFLVRGFLVNGDPQTRSMLQTDQQFPSLNSQSGKVEMNADGSTDVYFGPEAPAGKENNWVQTVSGKGFWLILRLYGPLESWFDKTWRPGKIEMVE